MKSHLSIVLIPILLTTQMPAMSFWLMKKAVYFTLETNDIRYFLFISVTCCYNKMY